VLSPIGLHLTDGGLEQLSHDPEAERPLELGTASSSRVLPIPA
jgi:hypothetical protein